MALQKGEKSIYTARKRRKKQAGVGDGSGVVLERVTARFHAHKPLVVVVLKIGDGGPPGVFVELWKFNAFVDVRELLGNK